MQKYYTPNNFFLFFSKKIVLQHISSRLPMIIPIITGEILIIVALSIVGRDETIGYRNRLGYVVADMIGSDKAVDARVLESAPHLRIDTRQHDVDALAF